MEFFFVYILQCKDGSYYVGHTVDVEQRLFMHNNQTYKGYTSLRLPVSLVYKQAFESRDEALDLF